MLYRERKISIAGVRISGSIVRVLKTGNILIHARIELGKMKNNMPCSLYLHSQAQKNVATV